VAFYKKENNSKQGVCLFKKKMPELPFKFLKRDDIKNRALGRGGVEELFEDQQWTNQNEVWIAEMLDSASKTIHWSDDPSFKTRNNLNGVKNNQVLSLNQGSKIQQLDTYPRNVAVFNDSVERFWQHAQITGSATDPSLGESPASGTPFKLYEAQQIEGKGMHQYRQGKLAVFMDEIYRDWILPHLGAEISKEQTFLEELSVDEMQYVVDKVVTSKANDFKKRVILNSDPNQPELTEELVEMYKQKVKEEWIKGGNKRFFEILKGEMKDKELGVKTNIAGKQKNLSLLTDKLVGIFRQIIATPQVLQSPEMMKLFNTILESSGLEPIMFGSTPQPQQVMVAPQQPGAPAQGIQTNQQV
jgi:hypothetical protein